MGLVSGLFGKFLKNRRTINEDEYEEFADSDSQMSSEQQVINCCERIMDLVRDLKKEKSEYDILTGYLKDAEILSSLPGEDKEDIRATAKSISSLDKTKDKYRMQSAQISDDRIAEFEPLEKELPDRINTLKSNEAYQSVVKRDMQYLEGEKHSWAIEIHDISGQQSMLNKALYLILVLFIGWMVICAVLTAEYRIDMNFAAIAVSAVIAVVIMLIYVRIQNNQRKLKQAEANINRAIVLLNQMKAKYVNITNAVNYAYDKFNVKSSYELNYLWEQYTLAVRERQAYERANEDLDYYHRVLMRELSAYHLYDKSIWIYNIAALIDDKEMVEVKHKFFERRQKSRSRIENIVSDMQTEHDNIGRLIGNEGELTSETKEILDVVERLIAQYA